MPVAFDEVSRKVAAPAKRVKADAGASPVLAAHLAICKLKAGA